MLGSFLFLQNLHLELPGWVFSWKMLLVVLGLLIAIKHKFRGGPWYVMMLIGGIFLAEDLIPWSFNLPRYGWPLVLVIIGVYMLIKRPYRRDRTERLPSSRQWTAASYKETVQGAISDDYLSALALFGSDNRIILSKNFLGGDITAIFGGSDLNFSQADFTGTVVLETTAVFGGIELVLPSNWDVKLEVNTIFGGVEDKRAAELMTANPGKVLVLRGTCVFGGIEIKSY